MLSTMTAADALSRPLSRYHVLEALEDASQPPPSRPADDPHPGVTVFNYTGVVAVVELLIGMTNGERQTVARELAEYDSDMADAFAAMILDAGYKHHAIACAHAEVTLADYVAGMVD